MGDLNRVSLLGRLGADPEVRSGRDGADKFVTIRIATSDRWTDKQSGEKRERTEWHHVVVYGPLAAAAEKYLRKGARVMVEGQMRTRKWQDQSGADRWSTEVVVDRIGCRLDVIDWPDGASSGSDGTSGDGPPGGGMPDDEIPF
jgi:single-strand DNA-binding protein